LSSSIIFEESKFRIREKKLINGINNPFYSICHSKGREHDKGKGEKVFSSGFLADDGACRQGETENKRSKPGKETEGTEEKKEAK
jgi:hypothetical protein